MVCGDELRTATSPTIEVTGRPVKESAPIRRTSQ
jgi:hypothetical protein